MTIAVDQGEQVREPNGGDAPKSAPKRRSRSFIEWLLVLGVAALLALGLRAFAFEAYFVPSSSMVPALRIGDRILVQKIFFEAHDLKRGDIIVFADPPRDTMCGPPVPDLVKRVIGLPGQRIYSLGSAIYIDGRRISEPYLPADDFLGRPIASPAHPYTIPANDFYVLGDNREDSCDSRYWGPVAGSSIVGTVRLLWWHNGRPDLHFF
jgi:signal peptidase I